MKDEPCCHEAPGVGPGGVGLGVGLGVGVGVGVGVGRAEMVELVSELELPVAGGSVVHSLLDATASWVGWSEPGTRDAALEPAGPAASWSTRAVARAPIRAIATNPAATDGPTSRPLITRRLPHDALSAVRVIATGSPLGRARRL
jgi:hypothetical protein